MKRKVINNDKRDKAWIGAVIGAAASIAGGIVSNIKKKKAQQRAYRQAQEEQVRSEGAQQSAAMSAQYANQDYVDEYENKITLKNGGKAKMKAKYNDRVAVAKRYKCGGRKKANFGSEIAKDFKTFGDEFKGGNLGNTIAGILGGISGAVNKNSNYTPDYTNALQSTAATANYINNANKIVQEAENKKNQEVDIARYGTKKKLACGGRKKGSFGVASMVSGLADMTGSVLQSNGSNKYITKSNGYSFQAPKTGIEKSSYQVDENGNPVNTINTNNVVDPVYADRIQREYRFGGRKRKSYGYKYKNIQK